MQLLDPSFLVSRLQPPPTGRLDAVLDTDTFKEIDDQFALVHTLLSKDRLNMRAVYAAPFQNTRAESPAVGMEKSYEEILRIVDLMHVPADGFVHRGSTRWMTELAADGSVPVESKARDHLIELARSRSESDGPLYVVAIGAITNVSSAIVAAPDIRENIVVLWLGGNPLDYHHTHEFNLGQDPAASRVLFDSGVPVVHFPCQRVAENIRTTLPELEQHLAGHSAIGDYLTQIFRDYEHGPMASPGISKEIWDLAPLAWLFDPESVYSSLHPSPMLTDQMTWSVDPRRHLIRGVHQIHRDRLFIDLFEKARDSEK